MLRLSDIIKHTKKFFEKKRKNPIQLENDSNLESNLKFLKVSDKSTPIQISDDTINIQGSLTVNGNSVQTGTEIGAITALNSATANELVTVGATTTELDAEANLTFDGKTLDVISTDVLTKNFKVSYDGSNYIYIDTLSNANTTIATIGTTGDISLRPAGGCLVFGDASNLYGEFNMNSTLLKLMSNQGYAIELETSAAGGATQDITLDSSKDIVLDSAADIVLDSGSGDFIAKKAGTEFSAANSAYAGMILGYSVFRNLGASSGEELITIGNSFAVLETSHSNKVNVTFVAPPSGNVEIEFTACVDAISKSIYFALSDNATYNELNAIYTYDAKCITIDESDEVVATIRFPVTGLTAGTSYQYWIGAKASSASAYIYHGANRFSAHSPPITVKAIALPATIVRQE